jgi:hypothetical protein
VWYEICFPNSDGKEAHSMAESKRKDWRELCAAAVKEQDNAKLTRLVDEIIEAIDQTVARSQTLSATNGQQAS